MRRQQQPRSAGTAPRRQPTAQPTQRGEPQCPLHTRALGTCGSRRPGPTFVYSTSTGKVRPGMVKMGQEKKYAENFSASSVADVTISFMSLRFWMTPCGETRRHPAGEAGQQASLISR